MNASNVIKAALGNWVVMMVAFFVLFPILGPALLWCLLNFFSLFDALDVVFRAIKG